MLCLTTVIGTVIKTVVSPGSKYRSVLLFRSTANHFRVTGHFEVSTPNDSKCPQNDLEHYEAKGATSSTPMKCSTSPSGIQNLNVFHYTVRRFRVAGHFETNVR